MPETPQKTPSELSGPCGRSALPMTRAACVLLTGLLAGCSSLATTDSCPPVEQKVVHWQVCEPPLIACPAIPAENPPLVAPHALQTCMSYALDLKYGSQCRQRVIDDYEQQQVDFEKVH